MYKIAHLQTARGCAHDVQLEAKELFTHNKLICLTVFVYCPGCDTTLSAYIYCESTKNKCSFTMQQSGCKSPYLS